MSQKDMQATKVPEPSAKETIEVPLQRTELKNSTFEVRMLKTLNISILLVNLHTLVPSVNSQITLHNKYRKVMPKGI